MEILTTTLSIILLLSLIFLPILIFNKIKKGSFIKLDLINYIILGLTITGSIIFIYAWWANFSDQLLLSHYGYNFDAMNKFERYKEVAIENMKRVKQLEIGYYGIGWPLQAIAFTFLYLPYLLIVYLFGQLINRRKKITNLS